MLTIGVYHSKHIRQSLNLPFWLKLWLLLLGYLDNLWLKSCLDANKAKSREKYEGVSATGSMPGGQQKKAKE